MQTIFCEFRRKWVACTPEECVRQSFLHWLVEERGFPKARIGVEVAFPYGGKQRRRCDAVIYDAQLRPVCLMEFKQQKVELSQATLDQIGVYNRVWQAPFLILYNGGSVFYFQVTAQGWQPLLDCPTYEQMCAL